MFIFLCAFYSHIATLYRICTCTIIAAISRRIQSTQWRMLRIILGNGRHTQAGLAVESWVEWVKRVASLAENKLISLGYDVWNAIRRQQMMRWVMKLTAMSSERWACIACGWNPGLFLRTAWRTGRLN